MFSNQYTLYQKESIQDHSKDGGPRCYHEFKYKECRIILIGECHSELPPAIGKQYEYIFNQFMDGNQNKKTKIYIERHSKERKVATRRTIINIFANRVNNEDLQIINADDRISNDGAAMFYLILEILLTATSKKNFTFNVDKINQVWNTLLSMYDKKNIIKLTLNDYEEILKIQLQKINALMEKYEKNNKQLWQFLVNCHAMINMAFTLFNQIKDEYITSFPEEDYYHQYLDDACIKMINLKNSLEPAICWDSVMGIYFTCSLDATLACRLSEEIHNTEDAQTLIAVVGSKHAEDLVSYFASFCQPIYSIPLRSNHETSIPPHQLQDCLKGEAIINQENTCRIM